MFLRVKPVRKLNKTTQKKDTYYYVYEVESYKSGGKSKQKTVRILGKYIFLEKQKQTSNFLINKAQQFDSREKLLREIYTIQLKNYGFEKIKKDVFKHNKIIANLKSFRVFSEDTNRDIYININNKFFGTKTLKKAVRSDFNDLFEFVRAIIDSGAVSIEFSDFKRIREQAGEPSHDFKLLQEIIAKFAPVPEEQKEISFEKFKTEIGY